MQGLHNCNRDIHNRSIFALDQCHVPMPLYQSNVFVWTHGDAKTILICPQLWHSCLPRIHETSQLRHECIVQYDILEGGRNSNGSPWLLNGGMHPSSQIPVEQAIKDQYQCQHYSQWWNLHLGIAHTGEVWESKSWTDYTQLCWLNSQTGQNYYTFYTLRKLSLLACEAIGKSNLWWSKSPMVQPQSGLDHIQSH